MTDQPKLLWHSNAPWSSTGYGEQTSLFLPPIKEAGWDVACSAFYGLEGSIIPWNGMPVFPGIANRHGNETIREHAGRWFKGNLRDGLVVTLMDVWVLDPAIWSMLNVASWVPVDHDPVPEPVSGFFHASGSVPIAMSRFGQEKLREAGLDPLYCPHAVDTEVYKPIPKATARETTKMPQDAFIVGMVAANKGNPSRKCFVEAFLAFKAFRERHDDAMLYLHTEITGMFDGVQLPDLLTQLGLRESVLICDQYRAVHYPFEHDRMAAIYSSLDVLLQPSAGEGFGIPAIEAQACGVPVIGSDFSAQPEVIGAGWLVEGTRKYTPIQSWQFQPDVEDIIEALEFSYRPSSAERAEIAERARAHALKYDVDAVLTEYMLPALTAVQERFEERAPQTLKVAA